MLNCKSKIFFFHFPKTAGKFFSVFKKFNENFKYCRLNCSIRNKILSFSDLSKLLFGNYKYFSGHLNPFYFKIIKKMGYKTFTIIRHPSSFLPSYYIYIKNRKIKKNLHHLKDLSFLKFINDKKVRKLYKVFYQDQSNFDWVGIYEYFNLTQLKFCDFVGIDNSYLLNEKKNISKNFEEASLLIKTYSNEINKLYSNEIDIYNYYVSKFIKNK